LVENGRFSSYSTSILRSIWGGPFRILPRFLASEKQSPLAIVGVICVILGLTILVEHRLVADRQTDGQTHDNGKYRASIVSRWKKIFV